MRVKNLFFSFLTWCAGADIDVLKNKARFSNFFVCGRSEQIKHSWMGAMVLIPPTVAFCGMLYAAETLNISHTAVVIIASIWSIIVFIFERYIVSSFRKTESIKKDLLSITFLVRFCFAIGVGFTIADPLILGIFKQQIDKKLSEMNEAERDSIRLNASILINRELKKKENIDSLYRVKENQIKIFDDNLTNEIDGIPGLGSGVRGDKSSAKEKRKIRDRRLLELQKQAIQDSIHESAIDLNISKIESGKNDKLKHKLFSYDYLAHRNAFLIMCNEPKNIGIKGIGIFLTVFLIFIDVICILYKAGTPRGPYDDHLNYEAYVSGINRKMQSDILNTRLIAEIEFNKLEGKLNFIEASKILQKHNENREVIRLIYESTKQFNRITTSERIKFLKYISKRKNKIRRIDDEAMRNNEIQIVDRMIKEFYAKVNQSFDEFSKL